MDAQEVCLALNISKRTLQSYREYGIIPCSFIDGKYKKTRSHTDNFGENNVKCLIAKGICRFVPHSSAGGF